MQRIKLIITFCTILLLTGSFGLQRTNYTDAKSKNVCKELSGDVLVYFIFVDSRTTSPWTEFDILSTLDSMSAAVRWLEEQSKKEGIPLNIKTDYFIGDEYTTIYKNLPFGSVWESVNEPKLKHGLEELNDWADNIANKAGNSFYLPEKDGIPEVKSPRNKERLVALLRDENNVESVALLYNVNNYFRSDISLAINTMSTDDVEFSIISYKYPSTIAHNILHLFGAADLYETPFRRHESKIKELKKLFPNDIMQDVYARNLGELEIGPYTKYLIGWSDELDDKYREYLVDKRNIFR